MNSKSVGIPARSQAAFQAETGPEFLHGYGSPAPAYRMRETFQALFDLAEMCLDDAAAKLKGDSPLALGYQKALASINFKKLTGMSLNEFYLKC